MTLKKINPEDLVIGREYYVKMKLRDTDISSVPFCFRSGDGDDYWFTTDQPIYTIETSTDTELEMLVNVASRLIVADTHYSAIEIESEIGHKLSEDSQERSRQWASAYKKLIAREALDLITACKNALKQQV